MKRIGILASMLAVVLAGVFAVSVGSSTASAADDPVAVLQAFIGHVNANDGAAMAASFTSDGAFEDINPSGGSFALFGTAALQFGFTDITGTNVTLTSSTVSGSTVTGSVNFSDDTTRAAGVDRAIQPFVAVVSGDKIASLVLHYDKSDAQTAQYLQYQIDHPDNGNNGPEPADSFQLSLGGNQTGDAFVAAVAPGVVGVFASPSGGPQDVEQPAAIRSGTCDSLGSVTQPLVPALNGGTQNLISLNLDDLLSSPHAITVSDSADNAGVIVSCANIVRSASAGLPNTGAGGSTGMDLSWLIVGLALAGLGLASGGAFAVRRR